MNTLHPRLTRLRAPACLSWLDLESLIVSLETNTMKSERALRHFVLAFLLALVCYAVFYFIIEHRRTRKGPWEVTFTSGADGAPTLIINQPKLSITNVQIAFPDEVAGTPHHFGTLKFNEARQVPYDVPFGKCIFLDTTFLPGTVTLQLYGHEIELLPRVLVIDRQEHPWLSGTTNLTMHPLHQPFNHDGRP